MLKFVSKEDGTRSLGNCVVFLRCKNKQSWEALPYLKQADLNFQQFQQRGRLWAGIKACWGLASLSFHRLTRLTGHLWHISTVLWGHSLPLRDLHSLAVDLPCAPVDSLLVMQVNSSASSGKSQHESLLKLLLLECVDSMLDVLWLVPTEIAFESRCLGSPFILLVCRLMFLLSVAVLHYWIINSAVRGFFILSVHWLSCLVYFSEQFETGAWECWLILTDHMCDLRGG